MCQKASNPQSLADSTSKWIGFSGRTPAQGGNEKPARRGNRPQGIDGYEEYRRLRSQRRGLTLFEDKPPNDDES